MQSLAAGWKTHRNKADATGWKTHRNKKHRPKVYAFPVYNLVQRSFQDIEVQKITITRTFHKNGFEIDNM
jgi:hypothetical protein